MADRIQELRMAGQQWPPRANATPQRSGTMPTPLTPGFPAKRLRNPPPHNNNSNNHSNNNHNRKEMTEKPSSVLKHSPTTTAMPTLRSVYLPLLWQKWAWMVALDFALLSPLLAFFSYGMLLGALSPLAIFAFLVLPLAGWFGWRRLAANAWMGTVRISWQILASIVVHTFGAWFFFTFIPARSPPDAVNPLDKVTTWSPYRTIRHPFTQYPILIMDEHWFFLALYALFLSCVFHGSTRTCSLAFPVLQESTWVRLRRQIPLDFRQAVQLAWKSTRYFLLLYWLVGNGCFLRLLDANNVFLWSVNRKLTLDHSLSLYNVGLIIKTILMGMWFLLAWKWSNTVFQTVFTQITIDTKSRSGWQWKLYVSIRQMLPPSWRSYVESRYFTSRSCADLLSISHLSNTAAIQPDSLSSNLLLHYVFTEWQQMAKFDPGKRSEIYARPELWDMLKQECFRVLDVFLGSFRNVSVSAATIGQDSKTTLSSQPKTTALSPLTEDRPVAGKPVETPEIFLTQAQRQAVLRQRTAPAAPVDPLHAKGQPTIMEPVASFPMTSAWSRGWNSMQLWFQRRSFASGTAVYFELGYLVVCAVETLTGMMCASLEEDPEGLVKKDLGTVLSKLLQCLLTLESFVKSQRRNAASGTALPRVQRDLEQTTILAAAMKRHVFRVALPFESILDMLSLEPSHRNRLDLLLLKHE